MYKMRYGQVNYRIPRFLIISQKTVFQVPSKHIINVTFYPTEAYLLTYSSRKNLLYNIVAVTISS